MPDLSFLPQRFGMSSKSQAAWKSLIKSSMCRYSINSRTATAMGQSLEEKKGVTATGFGTIPEDAAKRLVGSWN